MTRVLLIVTGRLEEVALAASLKRVFPHAALDTKKRDSFTSARVPDDLPQGRAESSVVLLARELVLAIDPGRGGTSLPYDFAFAIDDLDLVNQAAPERVTALFRSAVESVLVETWPSLERREKCRARIRERCSFHLFAPMPEAYFFAEAAALTRAGCKQPARLVAGADLEAFAIDDSTYEGTPGHPKRYLQHLLEPDRYRETKQGKAALEELAWRDVLAPREHAKLARSLFVDLASALGADLPLEGTPHACTWTRADGRVLRNI